jgi:ferredoxin-NADP reductase
MATEWQAGILRRIVTHTPRVKSFFFELPRPFAFLAGQHVDVRLTAPDGYQAQRSYSIASSPDSPDSPGSRDLRDSPSSPLPAARRLRASPLLEITIDRLDDGEVSPFFHDIAAEGDEIELRGPLGGHFIWRVEDGGPVLLVGGGSGVVPLMSMIRHRHEQQSSAPMLLLFSARTWDDVIYRDELLELAARREGFELVLVMTRDTARRERDYARRIDDDIAKETLARLPATPKHVFVCGSNLFVEAAAQRLITAGVSSSLIRTERYGG